MTQKQLRGMLICLLRTPSGRIKLLDAVENARFIHRNAKNRPEEWFLRCSLTVRLLKTMLKYPVTSPQFQKAFIELDKKMCNSSLTEALRKQEGAAR